MKYNKIYVLSPANLATGGIELSHQLVSILRDKGLDAYIVYLDKMKISESQNITKEYLKYNIKSTAEILDEEENLLVLPEIYFDYMFDYTKIQLGFWWMSVDNHYNAACFWDCLKFNKSLKAKIHIVKEFLLHGNYNYKNSITKIKVEEKRIMHFYQSHYAQFHLYSLGFSKVLPLSDFINSDILSNVNDVKKENIVLYNPKKGLAFSKKIISRNPKIKFIPLFGYSRDELNSLFDKAKIYMDFGNFPGKDRLPREAVIHNCCIITGMNGASFFYEDLPISEKYKLQSNSHSLDKVSKLINDIFENYTDRINDFSYMKKTILDERKTFELEIDRIFEQ